MGGLCENHHAFWRDTTWSSTSRNWCRKYEAKYDIAHDHIIDDEENENFGEENDDWIGGSCSTNIANYLAKQDFDDANDPQVHWGHESLF